ncbi:MAG: translation elongation factor Ts [Rhodobacteraceae bacterium]|nr:translation elongation factor Ts [Paracoccaceae bacterium]
MKITTEMIKQLRDRTGAGLMDAKEALSQNEGNLTAALDWLRLKGKAKAASKADRTAAEGLVGMHIEDGVGVLVEVNSETDFAARNPEFAKFVVDVCKAAATVDDIKSLMSAKFDGTSIEEMLTEKIAKLRENIVIRNMKKVSGDSVHGYVHNQVIEGAGKIGTLVAARGLGNETGKKIAMHVAAARPISLSEQDAPSDRVERERRVLTQMAEESGKPDNIMEKMVSGGLRKFFANETLLKQKYVVNPEISVEDAVKQAGGEVTGFAYLKVGEAEEQ